jgi:hypothetical protein
MLPPATKQSEVKFSPNGFSAGWGRFLVEILCRMSYSKKDYTETQKEQHSYKTGT